MTIGFKVENENEASSWSRLTVQFLYLDWSFSMPLRKDQLQGVFQHIITNENALYEEAKKFRDILVNKTPKEEKPE